MAYTPTNWANGDVITAEKMNKIESGLANSGELYMLETTATYDENDNESYTSVELNESGLPIILKVNGRDEITYGFLSAEHDEYYIFTVDDYILLVTKSTGEVSEGQQNI